MEGDAESEFAAFVRARRADLARLGWSLTGDEQRGEDVAQIALNRLWARWTPVSAEGDPWPYAVRVVVSVAATERRRWWQRHEVPIAHPPDRAELDMSDEADMRAAVRSWMVTLSVRQRQVVVLRFLMDLSVETAEALNCSTGTVKAQTSRALTALRRVASSPTTEPAESQ